jgi:SAM-dependent methyltransferase
MDPTATGRAYDQVARDWQQNTAPDYGMPQLERAIAFTKDRGEALDIGCGSRGRAIDVMLNHGFRPEVIDISAQMISLARERHPDVSFHEGDICTWPLAKKYDLICAWDSVWHVPLAQQEPVMARICAALTPGGVYLFTTAGLDEPADTTRESHWGILLPYGIMGIPKTLGLLTRFGCVLRHLEFDQFPEKHLVIIAQKSSP